MKRSKPQPVQVEQIFDDGTHPAIKQTLFGDEYGAPSGASAVIIPFPVCPGQIDIFEEIQP